MPAAPHIQQIVKKLQALPPAKVAQVKDFIDFLSSRMVSNEVDRGLVQMSQAITQPGLTALWDNPDDAEYDRL